MNLSESCVACGSPATCECKANVRSFFEILIKAHERVLSTKDASVSGPVLQNAGVDKLNGSLLGPVPSEAIHRAAIGQGFLTEKKYLKDRRRYLCVSKNELSIHFKLALSDSIVVGLVSNPNSFGSWQDYCDFLNPFISIHDFGQKLKVNRVDLNLDFAAAFTDFLQQVDVVGKQKSLTYQNAGGSRTGVIIGKGNEQVVIYDKSLKEGGSLPLTRVEIRLSGAKVPAKEVHALPEAIIRGSYFKGLKGHRVECAEEVLLEKQQQNLDRFKTLVVRDGFFGAKKAFNTNRNFKRDFEKILRIEPWVKQPQELFAEGINKFFANEEGKIKDERQAKFNQY